MPLDPAKKTAIGEVIDALVGMQVPRGKRLLCGMFMDLVDRVDWPQYYEVNFFFFSLACLLYILSALLFCFLFSVFVFFNFYVDVFFWTFFFFLTRSFRNRVVSIILKWDSRRGGIKNRWTFTQTCLWSFGMRCFIMSLGVR